MLGALRVSGRLGGFIRDKCGREIEVGQVADVFISDIVSAYIVQVDEGGIADAHGRVSPATVVLQIVIPMRVNPDQPVPIYVTRESDKPKGKERVM